jgi:predicted nucleotidyltransferase
VETAKITAKSAKKLALLGVGVLYLFGSRAMGVAGENSDYDVGIVLTDSRTEDSNAKTFNAIYDVLSDIFPDTLGGPKLDISFLQSASAALQMSAIHYGKVLFEKDPVLRANYEESVLKQYDDYRFLQKEYEEATLAAFRA